MMSKRTEVATSEPFQVRLLGRFNISRSDHSVAELPTQKSKALFALIVLAGTTGVDRIVAASMLWSRGTDAQARTNLRQTLASIRKTLGGADGIIVSEGSTLRLAQTAIRSDIAALEAVDSQVIWDDIDTLGPLLDGIRIDEPGFADWLTIERASWQSNLSIMLFDMVERLLARGAWNDAKKANSKLLSFDAFDEGAHRQAMRIYAAMGAQAQALRHYDDLTKLLKSELDVAPSAATQELMMSLRISTEISDVPITGKPKPPPASASGMPNRRTRTSVVVFPFTILGSDGDSSTLAGIAEDIATELGRFKTLDLVLAPSDASFREKEDIGSVASYTIEGSVRLSGKNARISVQLLDGQSKALIWAERYDRQIRDSFAIQDDVTRCVAAAIPGRVQADAAERAARQDIDTLNAHELMLRGKMLRDVLSAGAMTEARALLERAIMLDPANARAQMYLSDTYVIDGWLGLNADEGPKKAIHHARLAVAADPSDVFVQDHLGFALLANAMWRDGQAQIHKTLLKIGNEVESNAWCGYALLLLGLHENALQEVLKSTERDPLPPSTFGWIRGQVFSFNCQYDEVVEELLGASILNSLAQAFLVGAYARMGRADDASNALNDFIQMRQDEFRIRGNPMPDITVMGLAGGFRPMWQRQQDWEHIASGLVLAGL